MRLGPNNLIFNKMCQIKGEGHGKGHSVQKKLNVTIFILSAMVKTPCGYDIRLRSYLRKTIPQN